MRKWVLACLLVLGFAGRARALTPTATIMPNQIRGTFWAWSTNGGGNVPGALITDLNGGLLAYGDFVTVSLPGTLPGDPCSSASYPCRVDSIWGSTTPGTPVDMANSSIGLVWSGAHKASLVMPGSYLWEMGSCWPGLTNCGDKSAFMVSAMVTECSVTIKCPFGGPTINCTTNPAYQEECWVPVVGGGDLAYCQERSEATAANGYMSKVLRIQEIRCY